MTPQILQSSQLTTHTHTHKLSAPNMSLPVTIDESAQWSQVSRPDVPPYELYTEPIEKASQDDRDYRIIRLENDLEVMLVHERQRWAFV